ncbi:MAG TPA: T9SS type A sorting domain-containing protein [Saprospiraceae bacterium]|nr:T9SS type A sorting domain-containing protein [Saprospiraceae bacterium]
MIKLYIISIFIFCFISLNAQLHLPLKFRNDEAKWVNLNWVEGESKEKQWFDNRVPPIIVGDTVYTFSNYKGSSSNHIGFSVKKINKFSGELYWELQNTNKLQGQRKAISIPLLKESTIDIALFDEAPNPLGPITDWNHCYPGRISVDRNNGTIVDSVFVNKQDTLLNHSFMSLWDKEVGIGGNYFLISEGYRSIFPDLNYNVIRDYNEGGILIKADTVFNEFSNFFQNSRIFPFQDSLTGVVVVSRDFDFVQREVIYSLYDSKFNLVNRIDLSSHLGDRLTFCVAYRVDREHIIIESGYQDFEKIETQLNYHLFDINGKFIDKIRYTLRNGIDNGVQYGHFYPLYDVVNNRILLTRSLQRNLAQSTVFDLFASDGDSIKIVKSIIVEGESDHFRTQFATMMDNGDIMMYVQQFVWGENGDYPRWFSWIMLDGQKMNIISNTKDITIKNNQLKIHPNPTNSLIHIQGLQEEANVRIQNINGQVIKTINTTDSQVDISDLTNGLYIFEIQNKHLMERHKILKIE